MTRPRKAAASAPTATRVNPAPRPEPRPEPEVKLTAVVGTTVEIEVEEAVSAVLVERPDGSSVSVAASGGRALYVVDQVGPHLMGGLRVTAVEAVLEA